MHPNRRETVSQAISMNKLILVFTLALISGIKSEEAKNETKIVGGDLIEISAVPYQAALSYDGKFICGASIIAKQFLLTAAHCNYIFYRSMKSIAHV